MAASNKRSIIFLAATVAALATSVSATVFTVGDYKGWTLNFDYQAWAKDKVFVVGDQLVFRYPAGMHNVFRVNGTGFQQCMIPPTNEALSSGYDVITLETPGRKWYVCGVGKHCESGGMKLFINVYPKSTPPTPTPSGKVFVVGDDKGWTLNFDYQAWAKGKQFVVGDKLVFKYPVGKHNVFRSVDGPSFQQCIIPTANAALTSGYDVITLKTPGEEMVYMRCWKTLSDGLETFHQCASLSNNICTSSIPSIEQQNSMIHLISRPKDCILSKLRFFTVDVTV